MGDNNSQSLLRAHSHEGGRATEKGRRTTGREGGKEGGKEAKVMKSSPLGTGISLMGCSPRTFGGS